MLAGLTLVEPFAGEVFPNVPVCSSGDSKALTSDFAPLRFGLAAWAGWLCHALVVKTINKRRVVRNVFFLMANNLASRGCYFILACFIRT